MAVSSNSDSKGAEVMYGRTIRYPARLNELLRRLAKSNRRSINTEIVIAIEERLASAERGTKKR